MRQNNIFKQLCQNSNQSEFLNTISQNQLESLFLKRRLQASPQTRGVTIGGGGRVPFSFVCVIFFLSFFFSKLYAQRGLELTT